MNIVLEKLDQEYLPIHKSWRLNERHYGALQGLDKGETAAKFGEDQVKIWRRAFDIPPPALTEDDERFPGHDPRYRDVDKALLPKTESLKTTVRRRNPLPHTQKYMKNRFGFSFLSPPILAFCCCQTL